MNRIGSFPGVVCGLRESVVGVGAIEEWFWGMFMRPIVEKVAIAVFILTCSATGETLSELSSNVIDDQDAWLSAVEDSRRISISKAAPRVKRRQLASNQHTIDQLVSKLTLSRHDYRKIVMREVFKSGKEPESTFEVIASHGAYYCFAAEGGHTGFCTEESTNKTFTW
jgi:hypothetical protein